MPRDNQQPAARSRMGDMDYSAFSPIGASGTSPTESDATVVVVAVTRLTIPFEDVFFLALKLLIVQIIFSAPIAIALWFVLR